MAALLPCTSVRRDALPPNLSMRLTYHAQATEVYTGNQVATKLVHIRTEPSALRGEAEIYKSFAGGAGIPRVHLFLAECEYYCMIFDLLGPSLEDPFQFYQDDLQILSDTFWNLQLHCKLLVLLTSAGHSISIFTTSREFL